MALERNALKLMLAEVPIFLNSRGSPVNTTKQMEARLRSRIQSYRRNTPKKVSCCGVVASINSNMPQKRFCNKKLSTCGIIPS